MKYDIWHLINNITNVVLECLNEILTEVVNLNFICTVLVIVLIVLVNVWYSNSEINLSFVRI
jgi:hypothetical protein